MMIRAERDSMPNPKSKSQSPSSKTVQGSKRTDSQTVDPFTTDDEMLEAANGLFKIRQRIAQGEYKDWSEKTMAAIRRQEKTMSHRWHTAFRLANSKVSICEISKRRRLIRLEREILVALVLSRLGLMTQRINTCVDVIQAIGVLGRNSVVALRLLSQQGRLYKSGLIEHDDPDEELPKRRPLLALDVIEQLLLEEQEDCLASSENELYDRLEKLTLTLSKKCDELRFHHFQDHAGADGLKWKRVANRFLNRLDQTLNLHKDWKLNLLRAEVCDKSSWIMLLALLGKELGHVDPYDQLFTGAGLARAASTKVALATSNMRLLTTDGHLMRNELVQPCDGPSEMLFDNPAALAEIEYELTEKVIQMLGLPKRRIRKSQENISIRQPTMCMEQLVLTNRVRESLFLAEVHIQNASRLMDDWGLGTMISYGHGPVLLFSGPPGTGKTAAAEALAHQLDKPILVADYSRIQNLFVGQTEKNIVRVFREAKRHGAVLFWDEADAMFFDRDSAHKNWEVRDVNVLLQQTEKFEGVCILATNRKATLDKALARRITLKVEFERPGRLDRLKIWDKMLPKQLPLANDVDLKQLSDADFSGGEIKNVVLNASRIALQRSGNGPVEMQDFRKAIQMEQQGKWETASCSRIGF